MSGDRDDVVNRVASRLDEPDGDDDTDERDGDGRNATNAGNAEKAQSEGDAGNDASGSNELDGVVASADRDVENVKQEWKGTTMYLPKPLKGDVGKAFKQLDLQLDDDLTKFQKTRHFYPLLVEAGKERLEGMERDEIMERLEGIDPDLETFRPDDS